MKKALLLLLFVLICGRVFSAGLIAQYRWRNNNGTETSATWKAALSTPITISDSNVIRLRMNYTKPGNVRISPDPGLLYSIAINGPYLPIKNKSVESTDPFCFANSAFVSNGQATTNQLVADTSFVPGRVVTKYDSLNILNLPLTASSTEVEWSIKPSKFVKPGTTYYFKTNNNVSNVSSTIPYYATLTTSADIPRQAVTGDTIVSRTLFPGKHRVTLKFITALRGHDHYELQLSLDNFSFRTFDTIPGDNVFEHQSTFTYPHSGTYFMRALLFSRSKEITIGRTIIVTIPTSVDPLSVIPVQSNEKTDLKVYPNPATANVSFNLQGYTSKTFTVVLSSLYGKQLLKQNLQVSPDGKYVLTNKPPPGTYLLNISGNNLSKSARVIVQ